MKKFLLLATLALAACHDGPTNPTTGTPATVIVTSPQPDMILNSSVQLAANVYDTEGKRIANAAFEWESSNPTVATVSNTGLVTSLALGDVVIRARASGLTGETSLEVQPDPCTTPVSLNVGQVKQISGPDAVDCITLAATTGPSDFLFIAANGSQTIDQIGQYAVNQPQLSPLANLSSTPAPLDQIVNADLRAMEAAEIAEWRIREQERPLVASRNRARAMLSITPSEPSLAAAPAEGSTVTYRVPNINANDLCVTYATVSAVVKKVSQHAVIAQDVTAPNGGFTQADFDAIAAEFESLIFPTDTLYFGGPTDRNDDGHITILYTSEVNKATEPSTSAFIAGFFWGGDLVKKSEYQAIGRNCPQTNEQEIFYLLVPDPAGTINNNPRSVTTVRQNTRGTIAHEFQHMINQGLRLTNPAVDSAETVWLNEALSHMAEEVVGRVQRGFGDFQNLTFNDVNPTPSSADDYNAFFRQNLMRLRPYMQRPDTTSAISNHANKSLASRGAGWLLTRYLTDQYSNNNAKAYLRHLVSGPDIGIRNIVQWSGGAKYDDIIRGFLISVYTDEQNVPNLPALYTVRSWHLRDVMASVNGGVFPLQVTPLPTTFTTQSFSASGTFYRLTRAGTSPATTFRMLSTGGGQVTFSGARVFIVRLQ